MRGIFPVLGATLAGLGVAGGAFGAHALKAILAPEQLVVFETGVRYQMYHALALLCVGWVESRDGGVWARRAGWLFVTGILLFSGSLYLLSFSGIRWVGALTPLGGLAFIGGWASLAMAWAADRRAR